MKKRLLGQRQRDDEINEQFASHPVPVNTESVDDLIRFFNNNVIGDVEEEEFVEEQKATLDILISPQPASKPPRLSRGSVPRMGELNTFQQEQVENQLAIVDVRHDDEEVVLHPLDAVEQRDLILGQLDEIINERYGNVLREIIGNNQDEREKNRLIAVYKSLSGYDRLVDSDELLHQNSIEELQRKIDNQFNTYVTWLKTRTNNYIQQYFQFATPKIQQIILALNQFPTAFFIDPDQADMLGNRTSTLNFKQITFFVCYIALLCIIIILYFIASLIKFINDVDTMFGIIVEIATENEDIRNLRNEYRTRACMTGLGLLEYTLRCIDVTRILKLMFSKVGIIPTIAIMCICIYVFRSQSPVFNWIYVLFFKVLRIVVKSVPTWNPAAESTKGAVLLFFDTQIRGVNQVAYEHSPPQVQTLVDTAIYVSNTTGVLLGEAKDFVNNTFTLVPLLCANLTEQVVNANYTDLSIRAASGTRDVVENNAEAATQQISSSIVTGVASVSNLVIDIATNGVEGGIDTFYLVAGVVKDYSVFWASLVIDKEDSEVTEILEGNQGAEVVTDDMDIEVITKEQVIQRLRDETQGDMFILKDESSIWLEVFQEAAIAGDVILHSPNVNKEHTYIISDRFSKIPKPIPANQITVDPRSFTTQTVVDKGLTTDNVETKENAALTVDVVKYNYVGDGRTSTENDYLEPEGQMVQYKKEAKLILDDTRLFDDIDFNSIIIPLMKDRYGDSTVNDVSLEKVPFEPPSNNAMKNAIHYVGGIVLKIALPETSIEELQSDLTKARNAINNIYGDSKIVLKKTILAIHDTSSYVLTTNQEGLKNKLIERANAIKSATEENVRLTLVQYEKVIKVAVVVVAGTAILYVAPAAVGLTATILPPLYTTSVAGLQLVGSMGYHSGRAIGYGGYVAVNNVFYPTARAAVYMLSRVLGSFIGNTIRINPETMAVTTTNEVTNFIFGNGAMWLPLDQSIGPTIQTVSEHSALVVRGVSEVGDVLTPFIRHNVDELARLISRNPDTVGAFATLTAAATASKLVGDAINDAKKNPQHNTKLLRGSVEKELLTPEPSPRSSDIGVSDLSDFMDPWYNGLTSVQKDELNFEYGEYIKNLSNAEKEAIDFKEDYRQYLIDNKKATKEAMDRDRRTAKFIIMKQIQNRINKEAEAETELAMNDATKINRPAQPETKTNSEERTSLIGTVSKFFTTSRGGSKKKRKGSAKKSTRKHKKKSGKKGKSHKRKGSNKKRRHTRR